MAGLAALPTWMRPRPARRQKTSSIFADWVLASAFTALRYNPESLRASACEA
jgi:hypothetical protein